MPKPQLNKTDNLPDESSTDEFAPRKYSAREHAVMGLKIVLIVGLFFGLLWLVSAVKAQ